MTEPASSPIISNEEDAPFCPHCGYDLRGAVSEQCSECGAAIDREALMRSAIPWTRRKEIGRVRAYLHTAWLIFIDGRRLAHEAAKPQALADARRFQRVTAAIVAVVLLGLLIALAAIAIMEKGLDFFGLPGDGGITEPPWMQDLLVPWMAGATMTFVMPPLCILLAIHLAGCQRWLFRLPAAMANRQERADAIACYTSAPLVLLLPAGVLGIPLLLCHVLFELDVPAVANMLLQLAVWPAAAAGLLGTMFRSAQWAARLRHAGAARGVLAIAQLLSLWLTGAIILLGLIPWCIGFLWLVLDSLF